LSEPDAETTESGLLDRVQRALMHAEAAARCYLALIVAEGRRAARGLMREGSWMAALVGLGLIGLALLLVGLAMLIESRIGSPGVGYMIVGGLTVIVFLVVMCALIPRDEK